MDAHNTVQWTVAILVVVLGGIGSAFPVFAHSVYTYGSDHYNLPIPAIDEPEWEYGRGWMADAVIEIPDHLIINDLDVRLTLTHESLFDLQILLKSPAATNVALNLSGNPAFIVRGEDGRLTSVGISGELFFDDEAQVPIEEAAEPFVGTFRPIWKLSLFDREDAYGSWHLQIYDMWLADTGILDSFELMITTPEPATAILLLLGTGLMPLFKPRRA